MQRSGFVSLWIGNIESEGLLRRYVTPTYSEDGDRLDPQFAKDFSLGRFNDSLCEAVFHEQPLNELAGLLKGHSYEDQIIPRFQHVAGNLVDSPTNVVILVYDYEYQGSQQNVSSLNMSLQYIGTVSYMK